MITRQIYAFVEREVKILLSDKVALFWVIVWPIFWIVLVAYMFAPSGSAGPVRVTLGVVNYDEPVDALYFTGEDLIDLLRNLTHDSENVFRVVLYSDESKLYGDLKCGKLDAGLIIPENFSMDLIAGTASLRVLIWAGDPYKSSITRSLISGFLGEFSKHVGTMKAEIALQYANASIGGDSEILYNIRRFMLGIAAPINATYVEVQPETFTTREGVLGWFVFGAVGMTFLTAGFSEGASVIYRERTLGSLQRILVSPVSTFVLIISLAVSTIAILLLTAVIVVTAGVVLVGAKVLFNPTNPLHWLAVALLAVAAFMSFSIGLLLSVFAKTYRSAGNLGTILGLIVSFTTGIWFPKSMLPRPLALISELSPFTWVVDVVRDILVFEAGFNEVTDDLVKISVATLAISVLSYVVYKHRLTRVLQSY